MTAEEIRKMKMMNMTDEAFFGLMLQEIAAQVAELNENLRKTANRSIFEQTFGK